MLVVGEETARCAPGWAGEALFVSTSRGGLDTGGCVVRPKAELGVDGELVSEWDLRCRWNKPSLVAARAKGWRSGGKWCGLGGAVGLVVASEVVSGEVEREERADVVGLVGLVSRGGEGRDDWEVVRFIGGRPAAPAEDRFNAKQVQQTGTKWLRMRTRAFVWSFWLRL